LRQLNRPIDEETAMRILTCGFLVALTACASAPTERAATATAGPTERVAAATVAGAPAARPANAAVVPSAAAVPVAVSAAQAAEDAEKPAVAKSRPGYTLSKQNGEAVYCRRETPTGSRRPVQTCYTADQLEAIEQATREAQDSMDRQRNSSGCGQFCRAGS
jgi:hypothetical protein